MACARIKPWPWHYWHCALTDSSTANVHSLSGWHLPPLRMHSWFHGCCTVLSQPSLPATAAGAGAAWGHCRAEATGPSYTVQHTQLLGCREKPSLFLQQCLRAPVSWLQAALLPVRSCKAGVSCPLAGGEARRCVGSHHHAQQLLWDTTAPERALLCRQTLPASGRAHQA